MGGYFVRKYEWYEGREEKLGLEWFVLVGECDIFVVEIVGDAKEVKEEAISVGC